MKPLLVIDSDAVADDKVVLALENEGYLVIKIKPGSKFQMMSPPSNGDEE